jgi:hypothetical protein
MDQAHLQDRSPTAAPTQLDIPQPRQLRKSASACSGSSPGSDPDPCEEDPAAQAAWKSKHRAAPDPLSEEILREAAEYEASYLAAALAPPLPPPAEPVSPDGGPRVETGGAVDLEMMD